MSFSEILNIVLGGGLVTAMIAIATMKATVRKANADAEKAKALAEKARADADTVRITNTENATRILVENIVNPLREELNATREKLSTAENLISSFQKELSSTKKELSSTKSAISRLFRAVEASNNCPHARYCPVLFELRNNEKNTDGRADNINGTDARYGSFADPDYTYRDYSGEQGGDVLIRGQPP